jgi:23S rRNA (cytidine1920-2'-O)/16S rRNA (cytidine1409-2'-O)-methyltransferase
MVAHDDEIELRPGKRYVSRAGEKLASVASALGLDFRGQVVLDVGSSTGGFTDYALQNGASKVYCVDVGTGQLDMRLRQDPRVIVLEQTDVRDVSLPERAGMAVIDVSFVSLRRVLMPASELVEEGGLIVAMAKPQFEASRDVADRYRGVIKDEAVRQRILEGLRKWLLPRFDVLKEADSGVAGVSGNREHFLLLRRKS